MSPMSNVNIEEGIKSLSLLKTPWLRVEASCRHIPRIGNRGSRNSLIMPGFTGKYGPNKIIRISYLASHGE